MSVTEEDVWDERYKVNPEHSDRISKGSFFFSGLDFEGTGETEGDWKMIFVVLIYKIDNHRYTLRLTRSVEKLPGGDNRG